MTLEDQKQQFSFSYARAVAATAQIAVTEPTVDDDSIDLIFQQRGGGGVVRSPRVEAQMKCTEATAVHPRYVAYPLKLKNYDELRPVDVLVPRILVVVLVPDLLGDWLNHSEQELAMRRCGYWLSLRGQPPTPNTANVTVHLPRMNQFTVAGLQGIMQRIGAGQLP
ncbi:MAG TPA: DUF4365 domain-containing protein [Chthoniobacteraceae bacterium]|jgi:hypothetical protein|nr:DUF4365 domain-containing protein [Chthoniobacteraceae bacterium]